MGMLDQVKEMRSQGLNEPEMSARLQEQGFSPKAINDAFNQEKIRSAVSAEQTDVQGSQNTQDPRNTYMPRNQQNPGNSQDYVAQLPPEQGQVPGLPNEPATFQNPQEQYQQPQYSQDPYTQQPQYPPQQEYYPEPPQQYPQEEYYPQDQYSQDPYSQDAYSQDYYGQGGYGSGSNTETIIEISEQVFAEKIKKMQRQVEQFTEFAALAETKIANNHERIKRVESIIDKLQISILDKIGDYGKNIDSIKKEMAMIEDSFAKVIPELKKKISKK